MKKGNIFIPAALSFVLLFNSCISAEKEREPFVPVDYTEEDAVNDEIDSVRKLLEKNSVNAFWRSLLIKEEVPENQNALLLYKDAENKVIEDFSSAIKDSDYMNALKLYKSLSVCGCKDPALASWSEKTLRDLAFKNVPGLSSEWKKQSVQELIKGTVTVFVDKGLKIEKGMGYADGVLGSGFFISEDGYIITNHHVISDLVDKKYEGFSRLYVKLAEDPDTKIPAKVIGYDSVLDLALLKCEIKAPAVFTLGSSADLKVGDRVYAIGSPLGLEKTLTSGIISATDRQLFMAGPVFQIDAAVNSGNSGGPLIDENGKVQAVVFAGVQNYQGLNFAIPVEYLRNELPFLYSGGERKHPWAGAYGKTRRAAGSGMRNEGLDVFYVLPGGSAFRSGVRAGDLIVDLDGKSVTSVYDFHRYLMSLESDTIVSCRTKNSDGEESQHLLYLEQRPESPGYEFYIHDRIADSMLPVTGMKLIQVSAAKKEYIIDSVIKGSAADDAGFSENDTLKIVDFQVSEDRSMAGIAVYAKLRKKGYLDVSIGFSTPLDSTFYF
ncbi:trypsin-like peptidase domain-containing protein [Treponema sp.]|uniref:S1C family serine protease n=1 Tax=Treponema sp. TaxID=166 RepID=UPI0025EA8BB6|nr:trypsin-like peptidase domain-containing protein [Treponema sp.]MCR5219279.1 S1C family serine protease [Treponema sp.]